MENKKPTHVSNSHDNHFLYSKRSTHFSNSRDNHFLYSKRSQEEMIGFVLIIVLVAVITVVFLAIQIRQPSTIQESREITDFLESARQLTTECKKSPDYVLDFEDLVEACYKNERCLNKSSCEVLNKTSVKLLKSGWDNRYEGYEFEISKDNETIMLLKKGNETGRRKGNYILFSDFKVRLRVYY